MVDFYRELLVFSQRGVPKLVYTLYYNKALRSHIYIYLYVSYIADPNLLKCFEETLGTLRIILSVSKIQGAAPSEPSTSASIY